MTLPQMIGWTVGCRDFNRYADACAFAREESRKGVQVRVVARYASGHRRPVTFFRNGYHRASEVTR